MNTSVKDELNQLRETINRGQFPREFRHFGGAELIITDNINRKGHAYDTIIVTPHASALSWLVEQLKRIYGSNLDYMNKYEFYPTIGRLIQSSAQAGHDLFDSMLYVVDTLEEEWA